MKFFTVLTFSVFTAMLLSSGCGSKDLAVEQTVGGTVQAPVVTATAGEFPLYTTAMGTVEPFDRARISTRVMGHVRSVPVQEGDRVRAGQVLLRLDSRDASNRIEQAKAGLAAAESQFKNAEAYYNRIKKLHEEQSATEQHLDNALTQYEATKAGASVSRNQLAEARNQLDYFNIKAPFGGFVTSRTVDVGDMGAPGAPLVTVEMQDSLKIVTTLSERDVGKVTAGQSVLVEIGKTRSQARVESVVPAGDPSTRRFKVRLVMQNEDGTLVSGLFARVLFQTGADETISVPESAIVRRGQLTGLFVLDSEQKTRLRWVRLGRSSGERIEVLSGLAAGERVVAGKLRQMREGMSVQEVNS
jgi:RND family efflux transporter MFP subunit